jgi:molybdopterin-guanine dinucleotide biosynthesis protein A
VSTSEEAGPSVSGILLAGGRSSRFGRDKLIEPLGGRPLAHHAIAGLANVCSELVVVVAPEGPDLPLPAPTELPTAVDMRVVRDPEPFGGPLIGLLAGLEEAREPLVIVAGADMPTLHPGVLRALVAELEGSEAEATALRHRGRTLPLPLAVRNGAATGAARRILGRGERSLTALVQALRTSTLDEADWRGLDPPAATLRDIDRPEDLR